MANATAGKLEAQAQRRDLVGTAAAKLPELMLGDCLSACETPQSRVAGFGTLRSGTSSSGVLKPSPGTFDFVGLGVVPR
jgi:hypothetical protein